MYFDTIPSQNAFMFKPRVDIYEMNDAIHFEFELPGISKEDVKLQVNDDKVMTVTGEKRFYKNKIDRLKGERFFGRFSRSFELPQEADSTKIEASFENGVLTVSVAKQIDIKEPEKEIKIN